MLIFLEFFYILQKKKLFLAFFQHCIKCSLINHFWQFWIFMWWSVSNVSFLCSFVFQIPRCSTYLHKFKKCNFHKTYFTIKGISICRSQTVLKKFLKYAIPNIEWNKIKSHRCFFLVQTPVYQGEGNEKALSSSVFLHF